MNKKLAREVKKRLNEAREQTRKKDRELYFISLLAYLEGAADEVLK